MSLALAGGAQAATCSATNTETLVSCVTSANANTEANTITLAAGTYTPEAPLVLKNTHGLQTIEGPTGGGEALVEGSSLPAEEPELVVVKEGVSAKVKNFVIAHAGKTPAPAVEAAGTITLEAETDSGNLGPDLLVQPGGTATILNSTLSDGSSTGLVNGGVTTVTNSTIAFNHTGGTENAGTLNLTNTIVAENTNPQCSGLAISTNDHNLSSDATCGAEHASVSAKLGTLFNNLGPTQVRSPQSGSPVIDAGDPTASVCPTVDQRGFARPDVGATACDIGAVEFYATAPTLHVPETVHAGATSPEGTNVTYTVTAEDPNSRVRTIECTPPSGSKFPIGTTEVHCTATDGFGVSSTGSFKVVVVRVPAVNSVTPNEVGSAGNFKVILHGSEYTEITGVKYGTVPATKIITTGTPTKGQCKVKSTTEMECLTPFHEHGEKIHTVVTNPAGSSPETASDTITFWPEIYRNEVAVGTAHVTNLGYGQIQLESPQIQTTVECVNLGFGSAWNEANSGGPVYGHGEISVWWASGHTPTAEHAELSSRCRFVYHGTPEEPPTGPAAWATAEPPLKLVNQEGIVCATATKHLLSECPSESERIHETVAREISREGLSVPWNIQLTEKAGTPHVRIGLPEECKGKVGAERTELSKCPENSEREPGKSPEGCNIPPTPDPPGCVKVQILSNPPLNVHMEYEGFVEPLGLNSGPNGLSPSSWEFEGHAKGEPSLRLRETPSTEGSTTGTVKILGFAGQELITAK